MQLIDINERFQSAIVVLIDVEKFEHCEVSVLWHELILSNTNIMSAECWSAADQLWFTVFEEDLPDGLFWSLL